MKRQVRPSNICEIRTFPSLWAELHGVLSIDIFTSMHVVYRESNPHSTANKDWGTPVCTTSSGQKSRFPSESNVYRNRRVKPESWRGHDVALEKNSYWQFDGRFAYSRSEYT